MLIGIKITKADTKIRFLAVIGKKRDAFLVGLTEIMPIGFV